MNDPQMQETPPAPGPVPPPPDDPQTSYTGAPGDLPPAADSPYLDEENAREELNGEPGRAPVYPISPADVRNEAIRLAWRSSRVMPTPPERTAPGIPGTPGTTSADPVADLRMYPQTINAEYLVPMSRVIEDAITANDPTAIAQYASGIAQEIAVGLIKKAYAAMDAAPRVSSITGAATTDNAAADSTAPNTVKFTAMDQNGAPMAGVPLVFSSSSGTTPLTPASGDTAGDGTLSVDLINSVAETVTVTATSGAVSGVADVTFTEPVAAREGRRHG